jgi:hypothetical protein
MGSINDKLLTIDQRIKSCRAAKREKSSELSGHENRTANTQRVY